MNHKFSRDYACSLGLGFVMAYLYHKHYQLKHKEVLNLTYKNLSAKLSKMNEKDLAKQNNENFYSDDNFVEDDEGEDL